MLAKTFFEYFYEYYMWIEYPIFFFNILYLQELIKISDKNK